MKQLSRNTNSGKDMFAFRQKLFGHADFKWFCEESRDYLTRDKLTDKTIFDHLSPKHETLVTVKFDRLCHSSWVALHLNHFTYSVFSQKVLPLLRSWGVDFIWEIKSKGKSTVWIFCESRTSEILIKEFQKQILRMSGLETFEKQAFEFYAPGQVINLIGGTSQNGIRFRDQERYDGAFTLQSVLQARPLDIAKLLLSFDSEPQYAVRGTSRLGRKARVALSNRQPSENLGNVEVIPDQQNYKLSWNPVS
jgi:hypothetical protein